MTIIDRTRAWQGVGGPDHWDRAWDRVRDLLAARPSHFGDNDSDQSQEDGTAALATALYIVAMDEGTDPAAVPRRAVESLRARRDGESDLAVLQRWEAHLVNLGHDVEDSSDPVSARWQRLRIDYDEQRHADLYWDDSLARHGFAFTAISYLLSSHVALEF